MILEGNNESESKNPQGKIPWGFLFIIGYYLRRLRLRRNVGMSNVSSAP